MNNLHFELNQDPFPITRRSNKILNWTKFCQGSSNSSSGNNVSTPQLNPSQLMQIYDQALPGTLGTTVNQATPTATGLANSASAANPIYTQSGLNQLTSLAPGYQQAGANLATQQALSTGGLLTGAGGQAATAASNLSNTLNPEQAASNTQATNLVNSINLNGLSGGENAAVERSLNQSNYATGNLGLDNATNAVSNAMNFGNALQAKRTALGSALGSAGGVASNQNTFTNPVSTALNSGNTTSNFGLGTFNPTQANSNITAPLNFGSSLGSQIAGLGAASVSKGTNSSSGGGGGICYLTTACCKFAGLADDCEELMVLRKFRDEYVPKELVDEYYKSSAIVEPKISNNPTILQSIHSVVKDCIRDIKSGLNTTALTRYTTMVNCLELL